MTKHNQHYSTQDCCAWLNLWFGFGCACLMWCHATSFLVLDLWFSPVGLEKTESLLLLNPKDQELVFHPCVNLHQEVLVRLLLNYFQKYTRVHLMLILSLPSLLQNQNLEIILLCIVVLCYPIKKNLNSLVWWMCEIKRAKRLSQAFVHLWPHEQFTHLQKYRAYQNEPNTDISEQSVSKQWIILQQIHFLLLLNDGHPSMALRPYTIVQPFYSQVRNIFPRIPLHDLPCHKTMKISFRHQVSAWLLFLVIFPYHRQKSLIGTYSYNFPKYLC